jgi:ABC-type transport system substrate-binding protein
MAIERSVLVETYANVSQLQTLGLEAEGRFHNAGVPAALQQWWLDPTSAEMGESRRWYAYDPREARALFLAAGIQPGTDMPFSFPRNPQGGALVSVAQTLASMLAEAGLQVRLKAVDMIATDDRREPGDRSTGIGLSSAVPHTNVDDWLIAMLHSSGPNGSLWPADARLDRLIERAQAAPAIAERKSFIYEIQRYVSGRMYFVPTAAGSAWTAVRPRVRNFAAYRTNSGHYGQGAEQWPWVHIDD